MIKPNIKLYFKKRKQRLSVFGISLVFDWRFILGCTLVVLVTGMAYATYLYVQISSGSLFETTEDQNPKIETEQKRSEIQKAVEKIQKESFDEQAVN